MIRIRRCERASTAPVSSKSGETYVHLFAEVAHRMDTLPSDAVHPIRYLLDATVAHPVAEPLSVRFKQFALGLRTDAARRWRHLKYDHGKDRR